MKRTATLSEWTELLDSDMTEGSALAGGTHAQPLKEYTSGSHISGVTFRCDIRKSDNGDRGLKSGTRSPPSLSGQAISQDVKGKAGGALWLHTSFPSRPKSRQ
jgi:hypothetical protein